MTTHTPGIFVTGTNTGVGKTVVSAAIVRLLAGRGLRVVGLKPVATGGERLAPGAPLRNHDALELQAAGSPRLDYELVKPLCFEPPIAPHIAAAEAGVTWTVEQQVGWYRHAAAGVDVAVVEGAGGWRVPMHPAGFLSDLPEQLGLGVIIVVGLTLGCLNHARLTGEVIEASGRCPLLGWIGNAIDTSFSREQENLSALARLLGSPPLAVVPFASTAPRSPLGMPLVDLRSAMLLGETLTRYLSPARPPE